jgi:hypothetical protein
MEERRKEGRLTLEEELSADSLRSKPQLSHTR